jgi:hypothetical protein
MTLLELLIVVGGDFGDGLKILLAELGKIRETVPQASDQIDALVARVMEITNGKFSPESLYAVLTQFVGLFSGHGWGPPNSGSVASA